VKEISLFLFLSLSAGAGAAFADQERFSATNKVWQEECGSCHVAYPPKLLPALSWKAIMADLARHFGAQAGIELPKAREIEQFLVANAGRGVARASDGKPSMRITETRWFLHEHDEVAPSDWKRPKVKTAANCGACHAGADRGDFSERDLRIPR
jgi:nitrate/TMAO reductase-like tetraheme cytochrome c subunit